MATNKKTLVVIAATVVAVLLLVKIVGWNKISKFFTNENSDEIAVLQDRIQKDSALVVLLKSQFAQQKDTIEKYRILYANAKDNYTVITKYYEKKITEVRGLEAKEAIEYFNFMTDCGDWRDTNVITRLSNIACANVLIAEREMFLAQRDTLSEIVSILEGQIVVFNNALETQGLTIQTQDSIINNYRKIGVLQEETITAMKDKEKKDARKLKRAKVMAIIGGSAAVVSIAVLILN